MLCVQEIYALENVVFCIAVYGLYKLYISPYTQHAICSNAAEINCNTVADTLLQSKAQITPGL